MIFADLFVSSDMKLVGFVVHVPKSFTSTALLFLRPVWWTVTSLLLEMAEPSLPLVILSRWMEKLEASAIFWKICAVESSGVTVTVSGKPLIGRPGIEVSQTITENIRVYSYHEGAQRAKQKPLGLLLV
jgi:hypothetical protein